MSIEIPPGLTELLQGYTVEVLRHRPPDLLAFAAEYFAKPRSPSCFALLPPPPHPQSLEVPRCRPAGLTPFSHLFALLARNGADGEERGSPLPPLALPPSAGGPAILGFLAVGTEGRQGGGGKIESYTFVRPSRRDAAR
uniref:RIIa domain-containing protein n=1 Tax=Podarcis muralis TaxID=64176 RepID=A0A670K811_PODMU